MFTILLTLWLIAQGYLIRSPWFFEQELALSFLPYSIPANILVVAILFVIRIYENKKRYMILLIIYTLCGLYFFNVFQTTYSHSKSESWWSDTSLTFFYSNIYYQNKNTNAILSTIENNNPDIIMLVEYSKYHDEIITPQIKDRYPYVSRYIWNKWYDGDIIFSKYPITKIDHTSHPWSFSHITISYNNIPLDIALVHTSAPVSRYFFDMRTDQLQELQEILEDYYSTHKTKRVLLAGDFNITPRSPYYVELEHSLSQLWLKNLTTNKHITSYNRAVPYTRCLQKFPVLCAHIDHIRSTNQTISLQQVNVPWSDHTGFLGSISME